MSARGSYKKIKNINKYTLKHITTKITGYNQEDSCFDAMYQEIKRIRKICNEVIPSIEINNLKQDFENKLMFIEYVYKFKKYKDILNKMKYKEKLTSEEWIELCLLLQYTNLYEVLDFESEELEEIFKFATYLGHIDSIIEGMRQNLVELFLRDSKLSIEYANEYIATMDSSISKVQNRLFYDLLKSKRNDDLSEEVKVISEKLEKELEEETIYVDCKGKMRHELDLSQYDDLSKVVLYNCGDIQMLINKKNKNK